MRHIVVALADTLSLSCILRAATYACKAANHSKQIADGLRLLGWSLSVNPRNSVSPEPLLLDIHGAARMLSATPWAVRSLLWDKQIPFVKIGRKHLIDPADLRLYVASQKTGGR
jgi:hypothetical protein